MTLETAESVADILDAVCGFSLLARDLHFYVLFEPFSHLRQAIACLSRQSMPGSSSFAKR
jgi:hypothetical protein